jgi:nitrogen fixation protein FixH
MSATIPDRGFDPRRGRWIPWTFAGAFAVVFAVNMLMIYYAVSTFTGVTVTHAYERGRGYEAVIAEAARQDRLGWQADVRFAGGLVTLVATDRDGRPLSGRVEGVLRRPLEHGEVPLDFVALDDGRWVAEATPPQPGQWEIRLTLFGPGETPFDIRRRVVVR